MEAPRLMVRAMGETGAVALLLFATIFAGSAKGQESDPRVSQVDELAASFKRQVDVSIAGYEGLSKELHESQAGNMKRILGELGKLNRLSAASERCDKDGLSEAGNLLEAKYRQIGNKLEVAMRSDTDEMKATSQAGNNDIFNYMHWVDAHTRSSIEQELAAIWKEDIAGAHLLVQNECLMSELVRAQADRQSPKDSPEIRRLDKDLAAQYLQLKQNLTEQVVGQKNRAQNLQDLLTMVLSYPGR
jgi:hypothetical protein